MLSFENVKSALNISDWDSDKETVEISKAHLKALLRQLVNDAPFDENKYLEANPDVERAVKGGIIPSGKHHYLVFGYFEGRKTAPVATVVNTSKIRFPRWRV